MINFLSLAKNYFNFIRIKRDKRNHKSKREREREYFNKKQRRKLNST